jgi:hypothetical protein
VFGIYFLIIKVIVLRNLENNVLGSCFVDEDSDCWRLSYFPSHLFWSKEKDICEVPTIQWAFINGVPNYHSIKNCCYI